MKQLEVTAQVPEAKDSEGKITQKAIAPMTILVNYPETIEEAKQMFGEEPILTNAFQHWKVTLQANMRGGMKKGEDQATLQTRLGSAKMGVATQGAKIDPETAYMLKFKNADAAGRKKMIEDLRKAAAEE